MTAELKALVFDNLQDLEPTASGVITMFKIAKNHMVLPNQEIIDALQEWIRPFDIHKVPGENISVACTQCRSVTRALKALVCLRMHYAAYSMALCIPQMIPPSSSA